MVNGYFPGLLHCSDNDGDDHDHSDNMDDDCNIADKKTQKRLDDVESCRKHLCFVKVVLDIAANGFAYLAFAS